MPAFGRRDDDRALVLQAERSQRLGFGLRLRGLLDQAALAVEAVELGRNPRGFRHVALQQQAHAEIGAADAPAGIDARAQHEAEMPGFRRAVEARNIHQRGMADMVAPAHRDQTLGDEGAVQPGERRDVGDGAERDVMQHAEQVGLRHFRAPEAAPAQFAVDGDQRHQHEADGGEIAETGEIVRPVRVHQRIDLGQLLAALVMVDDDDGHAELPGFGQRLDAGGAAIDRHQQRRALSRQHADGFGVGAVALEQPVGNVDQRIEAAMPQMPGQQRGGGRAVDVVVAEDRNSLAALDGVGQAGRRALHVDEDRRIGHQRLDGRIEESRNVLEPDAARGEHAAEELRQVVLLADRGREGLAPRLEALAPGEAAGRSHDAQEGVRPRYGFRRDVLPQRDHAAPPDSQPRGLHHALAGRSTRAQPLSPGRSVAPRRSAQRLRGM